MPVWVEFRVRMAYNNGMTATVHALVSSFIAEKVPSPAGAVLLSFGSHYILDSIPHWDFGTNWRNRPKNITGMLAIAETVIGIGIAYVLVGRNLAFGIWSMSLVAGLLPDWLETPWYILFASQKKHIPAGRAGILERLAYQLYKIPNVFHAKAQLPFGALTQIAAVIFFYFLTR